MAGFSGFPPETFGLLEGIGAHNDKAWFEANRPLYETGYLGAGAAFVAAIGPRLKGIAPELRYEPKINGSVARINRDIRFSKDKRPYKDHLDLMFWHGERRGFQSPGFWFRLRPDRVYLAVGMHRLEGDPLARFRDAIVHPRSGRELLEAVEAVRAAGRYEIGEKTRRQPPRGYEAGAERAEYLLYEGLTAMIELPARSAADPGFAETAFAHYSAMWPIGRWLLAEVAA